MQSTQRDVARLHAQGYCCSQIIVLMALEATNDENPELVNAMRGLCKGLHAGRTCGTLSAGACLLAMFDPKAAETDLIPRLTAWFEETFQPCYCGTDCKTILGDDPMNKFERCPRLITETYDKCRELLSEIGVQI
jgi:hypothetical protein